MIQLSAMVEVIYRNRLGNRLFQYCLGRIVAQSLKWQLKCHPINGFSHTRESVQGAVFSAPTHKYDDKTVNELSTITTDPTPRHIVLRGWFQQYKFFASHASQIHQWLQPDSSSPGAFPASNKNDLLLHLRLGADYERRKWIIDPDFYLQVLDIVRPLNRIFICYDWREQISQSILNRCLSPLLHKHAQVFQGATWLDEFNFVRQFQNIAIAPSTFCWWAAYLSRADSIYFPDLLKSITSCWRANDGLKTPIDLQIAEPRYRYIKARTLWDNIRINVD